MKNTDIINADEPLTIDVPAPLTNSKRRRNAYHCVFAEACMKLPRVAEAIVHVSTAYIRWEGEEHFTRYRVPVSLRDQIVSFDKTGGFDPGEYRLVPIQPSHRAWGKRQGGPNKELSWKDWIDPKRDPPKPKRKRVFIKGIRAPANIASL
jgi:hypothetical protein